MGLSWRNELFDEVDGFMPIYNLASLEMLLDKLSTLAEDKPLRWQRPQVALPAAPSIEK